MADGDDLVIGENNQAMSTTQLVPVLGSNASPVFKVADAAGSATCIYGVSSPPAGGGTGVRGDSEFGVGVHGKSSSSTAVKGESATGVGVHGISASASPGVIGDSATGAGVRGQSPFGPGVVGESTTGEGVRGRSANFFGVAGISKTGTGVFGTSRSSNGVEGTSEANHGVAGSSNSQKSGAGVHGIAYGFHTAGVNGVALTGKGVRGDVLSGGTGVYGTAESGTAVAGFSKTGTAVYGQTGEPTAYAGHFDGSVLVTGDFTVLGPNKNAAVLFPDGSYHLMYCQESPEPWFEDFGESTLLEGRAEVRIEPEFAKTIDLTRPYHVFMTPHDARIGGLAVTRRLADRFVVEAHSGGAGGTFSYRVVGRRKDVVGARLAAVRIPPRLPTPQFLTKDDVPPFDESEPRQASESR